MRAAVLTQQRVAGLVAEAVVDDLEVVQVEQQDRDLVIVAPEGSRHLRQEPGPVAQTGQQVMIGASGRLIAGEGETE